MIADDPIPRIVDGQKIIDLPILHLVQCKGIQERALGNASICKIEFALIIDSHHTDIHIRPHCPSLIIQVGVDQGDLHHLRHFAGVEVHSVKRVVLIQGIEFAIGIVEGKVQNGTCDIAEITDLRNAIPIRVAGYIKVAIRGSHIHIAAHILCSCHVYAHIVHQFCATIFIAVYKP